MCKCGHLVIAWPSSTDLLLFSMQFLQKSDVKLHAPGGFDEVLAWPDVQPGLEAINRAGLKVQCQLMPHTCLDTASGVHRLCICNTFKTENSTSCRAQVATMTNGSVEVTHKFLDRSGLSEFVKDAMDIAEVQLWKPHAEVYHHAAKRLGLQTNEVSSSFESHFPA